MAETYLDDISGERRKAIAESINTISLEDLKTLGEGLFPIVDHPWRERFFNFLAEHPDAAFYYATTHDRFHIIYCHDVGKGMWFLPGLGTGPLQPKGLAVMKEIVEKGK